VIFASGFCLVVFGLMKCVAESRFKALGENVAFIPTVLRKLFFFS